tara:strand:+ start:2751 stop:2861 length:111 start_codon:yes stop_codon:yes gene_type:complete
VKIEEVKKLLKTILSTKIEEVYIETPLIKLKVKTFF